MTSTTTPTVSDAEIDTLSAELFEAWSNRSTLEPLRTRSALELPDAYRVQLGFVQRRLDAGEQIVGKKIGVTSKAMQDSLGVDQPDFGQLTSGMDRSSTGVIDLAELIAPRAEAELAFVLSADLVGPGITAIDVLNATEYVAPCVEIVDSRIANWDIGIIDTVADNASAGQFVISGAKAHPLDVDMALAGMIVEVDGEIVTTGAAAAVQSGPANAVAWLANTLGALGLPFRKGEVILSGSQSILIPAVAGTELKTTVSGLGSCTVRFIDSTATGARQ
ncbi:MAG: 2-oxopent-4-enoate hydratase [Acidimicrobiales bacterium]